MDYVFQHLEDRIELLHNNDILHRDIKPDIFLIGSKKKTNVDIYYRFYHLSKKYKINNQHIEYKKSKNFTGSYRYCSDQKSQRN